ncbi:MAG: hypothetical protein JST65_20390 [Acidobacteria bacterium]|nr:hypothetical protein [Acidobacteriota bacterium]
MAKIKRKQKPPAGITDCRRFKKYLRLDFERHCAYCHQAENLHLTYHYFGVEHFKPRSKYPKLIATYSNLLYCCNRCNSIKGEFWPSRQDLAGGRRLLDPCVDDHAVHLGINPQTGAIVPKSEAGDFFARHLYLDREELLVWRARKAPLQERVRTLEEILRQLEDETAPGANDAKMVETLQDTLDEFEAALAEYGSYWTD